MRLQTFGDEQEQMPEGFSSASTLLYQFTQKGTETSSNLCTVRWATATSPRVAALVSAYYPALVLEEPLHWCYLPVRQTVVSVDITNAHLFDESASDYAFALQLQVRVPDRFLKLRNG